MAAARRRHKKKEINGNRSMKEKAPLLSVDARAAAPTDVSLSLSLSFDTHREKREKEGMTHRHCESIHLNG